jgi:cation transport ATPase
LNQQSIPTSHVKGRKEEGRTISIIRAMLLTIFILGSVGSAAELLLLNHFESLLQWIPLLLILVSFVILGWHAVRQTPASTRAIQGVMIAFIAAGFAGFYFHYQGSAEFKLESNPSLAGWRLFWEAIRVKAPPALAPGVMIQLALIGLAYTYRHPALLASTKTELKDEGEWK